MRPGRIEVYRSPGLRSWRRVECVENCDHSLKAGVGGWSSVGWHHQVEWVPQWSWRFLASNGREVARCSEAYKRLRDVARSLELAFPGYRLLDQSGGLEGPEWFLWGWEINDPEAYPSTVDVAHWQSSALVLAVAVRGVRIPVATPVNLGSRR